jgi:hypothetical protein
MFASLPVPAEAAVRGGQPVQGPRLVGQLPQIAGQAEGGLVMGDGVRGVTGDPARVAEAVQRDELALPVAKVARDAQRPLETVGGPVRQAPRTQVVAEADQTLSSLMA